MKVDKFIWQLSSYVSSYNQEKDNQEKDTVFICDDDGFCVATDIKTILKQQIEYL